MSSTLFKIFSSGNESGSDNGSYSRGSPAADALVCFATGAIVASSLFLLKSSSFTKSKGVEARKALQRSGRSNGGIPKCIYLDYNGTTPIYPEVLKSMMPFLETHFGNPSSGHSFGLHPSQAVDHARKQVLSLLKAPTSSPIDSIWFTSCGTESDNLAIELALQSTKHRFSPNKKPHIVTCNVEHPAVELPLQVLSEERKEINVTFVPVEPNGRVNPQAMIQAIRNTEQEETVLVTLMLANNEVGALQPVAEVAQYCRAHGILFHTDAAQATGKVSVALDSALGGADMVTIVGHKIGAPKGIACLYVRHGCLEEANRQIPHKHGIILLGGGQEHGRRGGTENVPYIVGLGQAAEIAARDWEKNAILMERARDRLWAKLKSKLNNVTKLRVNGPDLPSQRLPNTLSVGIAGIHSGLLLAAISDRVAASAGATCHSAAATGAPGGISSSVLRAMNVPPELARGTLRLSVGPHSTIEEMDQAVDIIVEQVHEQLGTKKDSN